MSQHLGMDNLWGQPIILPFRHGDGRPLSGRRPNPHPLAGTAQYHTRCIHHFWAVCVKHELVVILCRVSCYQTWSDRLVDSIQTYCHLGSEQIFIKTLLILCPQVLLVSSDKVSTILHQLKNDEEPGQIKGDEETGKHLADQKPTPDQKPDQEPAPDQKPTSFMFDHQVSSHSMPLSSTKSSFSLPFLAVIWTSSKRRAANIPGLGRLTWGGPRT
jgi:hypothetical protein